MGDRGWFRLRTYKDEDKDHVRISVKMMVLVFEEAKKRLFERFYEGGYRKHKTTGTGIGLSLVRDLVMLSHGTIEVESELGMGSEFIVTLPIDISYFDDSEIDLSALNSEQPEAVPEEDAFEEEMLNKGEKPGSLPAILVVEDNDDILQLLQRLLGADYYVYTATNGEEAMELLEHEKIDLVVSDIMMPRMDGIEMSRLIKSNIEYSHTLLFCLLQN